MQNTDNKGKGMFNNVTALQVETIANFITKIKNERMAIAEPEPQKVNPLPEQEKHARTEMPNRVVAKLCEIL
jgi:hypothetical protein